jgi:hypothetical protein
MSSGRAPTPSCFEAAALQESCPSLRPVCLPVLSWLVVRGTNSKSRLWLTRRMAQSLAAALSGRMTASAPVLPTRLTSLAKLV